LKYDFGYNGDNTYYFDIRKGATLGNNLFLVGTTDFVKDGNSGNEEIFSKTQAYVTRWYLD
jgi:hypothetical protein